MVPEHLGEDVSDSPEGQRPIPGHRLMSLMRLCWARGHVFQNILDTMCLMDPRGLETEIQGRQIDDRLMKPLGYEIT